MRFRDIIFLLGIGLAGYFMLKYIAKAKKEEEKAKEEEQKTIQSIRTQHETEQIKTQPYYETQKTCETLYNEFYRDCLAYGGSVVDSESLHLLSASYNVVNEKVICDKKYYCVIIYEEEFRKGGHKPEPEPPRRYMV